MRFLNFPERCSATSQTPPFIAKALRLLTKKPNSNRIAAKNKEILPNVTKFKVGELSTFIKDREFLTPLEEARLVIEEIIIPKNKAVDLVPRTSDFRKQQHELISHYQLTGVTIGKGNNKRLRILPR